MNINCLLFITLIIFSSISFSSSLSLRSSSSTTDFITTYPQPGKKYQIISAHNGNCLTYSDMYLKQLPCTNSVFTHWEPTGTDDLSFKIDLGNGERIMYPTYPRSGEFINITKKQIFPYQPHPFKLVQSSSDKTEFEIRIHPFYREVELSFNIYKGYYESIRLYDVENGKNSRWKFKEI